MMTFISLLVVLSMAYVSSIITSNILLPSNGGYLIEDLTDSYQNQSIYSTVNETSATSNSSFSNQTTTMSDIGHERGWKPPIFLSLAAIIVVIVFVIYFARKRKPDEDVIITPHE